MTTAPDECAAQRWLERALLLCALAAGGWFLFAAAQRVPYPHELEWMEGALADHAFRWAHGLPVYCAPGPEHVPFLYAPLFYWLGGLGIAAGLDGILALRLVAVAATVATAALIGVWVRAATRRSALGFAAAGLFLAGYGWLAWWYDLARNDGLFVVSCVATGWQLHQHGRWRWLVAAACATLAVLAKQSALMWLPAIAVGALIRAPRQGLRFAVAAAAMIAAVFGGLHLASDGWSTFYLFEMPRHHGWVGDRKLGFWTQDVLPMLPLLALGIGGFVHAVRAGAARDALFLAAFGSGALLTSWLSRMHVGGFDNVLMYGFAGACVLGPLAAAQGGRRWRLLAGALLLVQFALLGAEAWRRGPATTLFPPSAHRAAHERLAAFVAAQPGDVWVPAHGAISTRAGKGTWAHGQAVFDLLQALPRLPDGMLDLEALVDRSRLASLPPRVEQAIGSMIDGTGAALREQRFAAIVVDEVGAGAFLAVFAPGLVGVDGHLGTGDDPYVRGSGPDLDDPRAIRPLIGYQAHSPFVLVPRR
jgi:hypothetical protein